MRVRRTGVHGRSGAPRRVRSGELTEEDLRRGPTLALRTQAQLIPDDCNSKAGHRHRQKKDAPSVNAPGVECLLASTEYLNCIFCFTRIFF